MATRFGVSAQEEKDVLDQRHFDLAHSLQAIYEEVFFSLLEHVHAIHGFNNLTLAGEFPSNSVANGKVYRRSSFKNFYIQSAAGDAGSAHIVASKQGRPTERFYMDHIYWGPSFNNTYHSELLYLRIDDLETAKCSVELIDDEERLCSMTADAIGERL